jgi:hypothetical protein
MTIEDRLNALEAEVKRLKDELLVTGYRQLRLGEQGLDHRAWLESHTLVLDQHRKTFEQHGEAMKELDARIAKLVSGFGEFMSRMEKRQ